ncbi:MAG: tetratricopeptide repeat protein, partial [Bacteroidia bacterium]|nr:tetratricopeptide repeat protein [Bacteroidia bacterium]
RKSLEIRKKIEDYEGISKSYNNIGLFFCNLGDYEKAIEYYKKAQKIKEKLSESPDYAEAASGKKGNAIALNNIGNVFFYQCNYDEALNYYQQALKIFEEINFVPGIASALNGNGLVFEALENYEKALEYYLKALKAHEQTKNIGEIANCQNNIGNVYSKMSDYDKALEYYLKALENREKLNDKSGLAQSYNNIGIIYKIRKDYKKATGYFEMALNINIELNNLHEIALNYIAIGRNYKETQEYDIALFYISKSMEIAQKIIMKRTIQLNYETMSEIYGLMNNFQKSLEYYKLSVAVKDSIQSGEVQNQISELQIKYETEKKQREVELLTKEIDIKELQLSRSRYLFIGLIGLVALIIVIALLFVKQNKLKEQQKTSDARQKLLRSQMNPHFIFNSLIAIQSFIFKSEPAEAGKFLSRFAKLMRLILDNSREEYVLLAKEINTLEHYLSLQKLRFDNKFDYSIDIDPRINTETISIPPMLAQPFIENSVEHGILLKSEKGSIKVRFKHNNGFITFEVEDNGIGFNAAKKIEGRSKKDHKSLTTEITKERLAILNKRSKRKIKFNIIDLCQQDIEGTLVRFDIPYKYL